VLLLGTSPLAAADGPYQATGFKVGEVTDTSAIVWTRLTRNAERNPSDAPMVEIVYAGEFRRVPGKPLQRPGVAAVKYPDGLSVADIRDAVPGAPGEVRVLVKVEAGDGWRPTAWRPVDPDRDFTRQFVIDGLEPGTSYLVRVESRRQADSTEGEALEGSFRTAPAADEPARVVFTVSTGQGYDSQDLPDGYKIYPEMLKLDPSFFVHTGDIVYYDRLAKTIELARYHWQRTYSLPTNVSFQRQVASYFIKDDHDTWMNDCWPGLQTEFMHEFTFEQGLAVFREQVPMAEKTYRTRRWGKDLQIWLVEGRDFRSPNRAPDGPDKTIWGAEQKAWFKRTVRESDAAFRILISPTPLVGPDRGEKFDNHSNQVFAHEGDELRSFIASQDNMVVICGDRHWQYVSVDPETKVREYSCGPVSDRHASGRVLDTFIESHHLYYNPIGGFLAVTVERIDGVPTAIFRHYDVDGRIRFAERMTAAD
jgi:alkaline phosphatase D